MPDLGLPALAEEETVGATLQAHGVRRELTRTVGLPQMQGCIFWPNFLSKLKSREDFEGGLHEKKKGKGGKERKKKGDKTHVKVPL